MTNRLRAHDIRPVLARRISHRAAAVMAAILAVLTVLASGPSPAQAATTSPVHSSTTALLRYSPEYMGSGQHYSQAQAVAIAQQFDVIAAHNGTFTPYVAAMKAANPILRIAVYMNGTFDQSSNGSKYPSSWYALDARHNRIRSVGFNNYLMDPANPLWAATVAKTCTSMIASSRYDGCLVDTLGTGPLGAGYASGYPINPATHQGFTPAAWMAATTHIAAAVQAANPGRIIVPNGLGDGKRYFDTAGGATRPLIAATGIGMAEIWLRVSRNPVNQYPSAALWQQDVNMLTDAESHGWSLLVVVKLWTNATQAQQDAWHRYGLASFLLGAAGSCGFSFSTAHSSAALTATTSYDHAVIGVPTGAYVNHGGLFERSFTHGVAAVNTGNAPMTVQLNGSYRNLAGQTVSSESLAPNSGDVFTH